eukprot:2887879-Rhodomonas_salina.1
MRTAAPSANCAGLAGKFLGLESAGTQFCDYTCTQVILCPLGPTRAARAERETSALQDFRLGRYQSRWTGV